MHPGEQWGSHCVEPTSCMPLEGIANKVAFHVEHHDLESNCVKAFLLKKRGNVYT